jgi:rod shape-determining protein MreC
VHDKVVRRRRAVLGLLVLVCVILLTAYFGESPSSPLHSVQRGIVAVVSPIQDGASKALSPVRDVSDWVSTTLRAKSENGQLERQVQRLTVLNAQYKQAFIENPQLRREIKLDQNIGAANYRPVAASVISRDPSLWYQQVEINAGSGDGIKAGDPVLADGALVGKVLQVTGSSAIVVLITDHTVSVAAEVQNATGDTGVLSPAVGNPDELLFQDLPNRAQIAADQLVVTAGFKDPVDPSQPGSLYPPGIPIGRVTAFSQNELLNHGQVPVTPLASIRRFTSVQVLTKPYAPAANVAADVPSGG